MLATIRTDLVMSWSKSGFSALKVILPDLAQPTSTVSQTLGAEVLVWRVTFSYAFIRWHSYSVNTPVCAGAHEFVADRPQVVVGAWSAVKTDYVVVHDRTAARAWIIRRGELRSVLTDHALLDILQWGGRLGGVPRSAFVDEFVFDVRRLLEVTIRAVAASWRCVAKWRVIASRRSA